MNIEVPKSSYFFCSESNKRLRNSLKLFSKQYSFCLLVGLMTLHWWWAKRREGWDSKSKLFLPLKTLLSIILGLVIEKNSFKHRFDSHSHFKPNYNSHLHLLFDEKSLYFKLNSGCYFIKRLFIFFHLIILNSISENKIWNTYTHN